MASGRILHLDGRDSAAALRAARLARTLGVPVVIDIDRVYNDDTERLLATVDYLIAAEEFGATFTGRDNPTEAATALAARFPQATTGITLGARGVVFVLDGRPERFPAFEVEVRDTTGAEMSFTARSSSAYSGVGISAARSVSRRRPPR